MSSEEEFEDTWETIEKYISEIGHSKEADIFEKFDIFTEESEDEEPQDFLRLSPNLGFAIEDEEKERGIQVREANRPYMLHGHVDREFVRVTFMFDIVSEIASVLSREQALNLIDTDEIEPPEEDESDEETVAGYKLDAADEFLASIETDHMRQFSYYLNEKLTSPEVSFKTFTAGMDQDGNHIQGYTVSKKIFPYQDDFTLRVFNDSVQAVINIGYGGVSYLQNAFIFDIAEQEMDANTESVNLIE